MTKHVLLAGLVLSIVPMATGCGKLSDSQQKDISTLVGGVAGEHSKISGASLQEAMRSAQRTGFIRKMGRTMQGLVWIHRLGSSSQDLTLTGCSEGTISSDGMSCTTSCPSASSLKLTCTASGSATSDETCNGTTYTFSNPSFSLTYDVANVTGTSLASATGSFSLGLSFSANVSGGSFDGKELACSLGFTFDIAKAQAQTEQTPALDCGNFSCAYDGHAADCGTIQSSMSSAKCS